MNFSTLSDVYAICRLEPNIPVPTWAQGSFVSITRTKHELSVVCLQQHVPASIHFEGQWRILEVEGPMDLSIVGVLASLTQPLAQAGINLFAISTFDTDYLLVKEEKLEAAIKALQQAGHTLRQ
jgi:uncharacterized protein